MDIKLKSGLKVKIKDVSLDERDEMLDSVEYQFNEKGEVHLYTYSRSKTAKSR